MLSSKNSKETHKFCLLLSSSPSWGGTLPDGWGTLSGDTMQGEDTLLGGYLARGVPCWGGTLLGGYPAGGDGTLPRGYPTGGYPAAGVPCWGSTLPGGTGGGGTYLPGQGGVLPLVSKLQLSSSAVSWPYIAFCPMELWVMLQSIMGVKKKKKIWDGYPPVDKLTK